MKILILICLIFITIAKDLRANPDPLCSYLGRDLTCEEVAMASPLYAHYLASFEVQFSDPTNQKSHEYFLIEANKLLQFVNQLNRCQSHPTSCPRLEHKTPFAGSSSLYKIYVYSTRGRNNGPCDLTQTAQILYEYQGRSIGYSVRENFSFSPPRTCKDKFPNLTEEGLQILPFRLGLLVRANANNENLDMRESASQGQRIFLGENGYNITAQNEILRFEWHRSNPTPYFLEYNMATDSFVASNFINPNNLNHQTCELTQRRGIFVPNVSLMPGVRSEHASY